MAPSTCAGYEDWELVVKVLDPSNNGTDTALHWASIPEAAEVFPTSPCLWQSTVSASSPHADADLDCADILCAVGSSPMRHKSTASGGTLCCSAPSTPCLALLSDSAPESPTADGGDGVVQLRVTADSFLEMQLMSSLPACSSLLPPQFSTLLPLPLGSNAYSQSQPESSTSDDEEDINIVEPPPAAPACSSRRSFFRLVPMLHWLVPGILCLVAAHHVLKGGMGRRVGDGAGMGATLKRAESGSLLYTSPLDGGGGLLLPSATATCRQAYGCSASGTAAASGSP